MRLLDLMGVFFNAILGGVLARSYRLDAIGFAVLAVLSGLGGGIIRDLLLQACPPVAVTDSAYLITAIVCAGTALLIRIDGRVYARLLPQLGALAHEPRATAR